MKRAKVIFVIYLLASRTLIDAIDRPIPARGYGKRAGPVTSMGKHSGAIGKKYLPSASSKHQPHGSSVKQDTPGPPNQQHPHETLDKQHSPETSGKRGALGPFPMQHKSGSPDKHPKESASHSQPAAGASSKHISRGKIGSHSPGVSHDKEKMKIKLVNEVLTKVSGKQRQGGTIETHSSNSASKKVSSDKSGKDAFSNIAKHISSSKHSSGKTLSKKASVKSSDNKVVSGPTGIKHTAAMDSHDSGAALNSKSGLSKNGAKVANRQSTGFSEHTKLAVIGGFAYNGRSLKRVEVIDLENEGNTCTPISDYPIEEHGMTAEIIDGVIKSCGGQHQQRDCFEYHPDKHWSNSASMIRGRYDHTASSINNVWLLSGGAANTEGFSKIEKWTGCAFEEGPSIQNTQKIICQLTVNATHVFFAKSDKNAHLLNWDSQTVTNLPKMTYEMTKPSCGLINHPSNGLEVVIAGYGKSEIFTLNTQLWKSGPDSPYFYFAGQAQLSDTFVVVGGYDGNHFLDTIHKFDNANYDWIKMKQHLETSSRSSGVVALPDNFITCSLDQAFNSNTKLVVIGGNNAGYLSRVEVFDLEDALKTCNPISDYPIEQGFLTVGVIQGVVKSCGGYPAPHDVCYDYHPESNTWVQSTSMMHGRYYHGASFIDNVWLLSGNGVAQFRNTTEYWTGSAFEAGPDLQRPMQAHCQLTLNATHVFFAEPNPGGPSYLLKWSDQTWTELPGMTNTFGEPSCGLINNPTQGLEAVVVAYGKSEIFNFNSLTWRPGPDAPYFYQAGYTQLSDTFVVVGGYNSGPLDTIYKFDNINYDWIPLSQHLQTAARLYPGVVTVPDSFVNCT